jgi:hypothetical protein
LNFALQLASSGNSLKKSINVIISNFYAKIIILGKYTGSHYEFWENNHLNSAQMEEIMYGHNRIAEK